MFELIHLPSVKLNYQLRTCFVTIDVTLLISVADFTKSEMRQVHEKHLGLNFQLCPKSFRKVQFSKCCPSTLKRLAGVFKFIHSGHARERFRKVPFPKCFSTTLNAKPAFPNLSALKSVFNKFRFRWTIYLS